MKKIALIAFLALATPAMAIPALATPAQHWRRARHYHGRGPGLSDRDGI